MTIRDFIGSVYRRRSLWSGAFGIACALASTGVERAQAIEIRWLGYAAVRGVESDGRVSYLAGNWGKFDHAATAERATDPGAQGALALDIDWSTSWRTFVHAGARRDPVDVDQRGALDPAGLLEAFVEYHRALSDHDEIAVRGGLFFLPTSFENVDPLWISPYTLSLSALNSWIGEEVRPAGLDLSWSRRADDGDRFALGATVFGGNDTMGTLLTWRGFAFHDRLTPWGDGVALHANVFPSFPLQSRETEPLRSDLDGRPGYSARASWRGSALALRGTYLDTRGDRGLHHGHYAWRTQFGWVGGELEMGSNWVLAAEYGDGSTTMGFRGRGLPWVDADLSTGYVLLSWNPRPLRFTVRADRFETVDRDGGLVDRNDESGDALTAAILWTFGEHWRLGVEAMRVEAERPSLAVREIDGDSLRVEVRYGF
jgi:hypothetical protein